MQTPSGLTINRSSYSATVNITLGNATAAAGGMDGEAPGTSAWIDLFGIDNGAAPSALGSLAAGNGKAPVQPAGYNYKCYLGAARVGSGATLLPAIQHGNKTQYVVPASGALPVIASGTITYYTAESVLAVVPPTAQRITINMVAVAGAANGTFACAPNNNYNTNPAVSQQPPFMYEANASGVVAAVTLTGEMVLESTNIYCGSTNVTTFSVQAFGWTDAVNAN
jgi:hypothetical protein